MRRWVSSRKLDIVLAIETGRMKREHVLGQYPDMSAEELESWIMAYRKREAIQAEFAQPLTQGAILRARVIP